MRRFRMQLHVGPSVNNKMISCATLRHADDYIHIMHERCFVRGLMRSWGPYTTSLAAHRDAQLKVDLAGLDHLTSKIAFLQVPHCHRSVHWIDSPEHQTLQGCLSWCPVNHWHVAAIFSAVFNMLNIAQPRQAVDEFIFKENKIDQLTPEEASASDQYFGTLQLGSATQLVQLNLRNEIVTPQPPGCYNWNIIGWYLLYISRCPMFLSFWWLLSFLVGPTCYHL